MIPTNEKAPALSGGQGEATREADDTRKPVWRWVTCPAPWAAPEAQSHKAQYDTERGLLTCQECPAIFTREEVLQLLVERAEGFRREYPALAEPDLSEQVAELREIAAAVFASDLSPELGADLLAVYGLHAYSPGIPLLEVEQVIRHAARAVTGRGRAA